MTLDENDENENHSKRKELINNAYSNLNSNSFSNDFSNKRSETKLSLLPSITNNNINNQRQDRKKSKTRSKSKSAVLPLTKDRDHREYVHKFYSNSWRIHSEFMQDGLDPKKPYDNTQTLFYCVGKKVPETFLFRPDWI